MSGNDESTDHAAKTTTKTARATELEVVVRPVESMATSSPTKSYASLSTRAHARVSLMQTRGPTVRPEDLPRDVEPDAPSGLVERELRAPATIFFPIEM
jgi:hypothetical protein